MGVREKEEERRKKKKKGARRFLFEARLSTIVGASVPSRSWRREFFSPPRHRPELQVARQRRQHPNVLDQLCKGKRGNFKRRSGQTVLSMPFPPSIGGSFSTALSPSKGAREPSQSNRRRKDPSTFFFFFSFSTHRLARQVAHVLGPRGHAAG